MGKSALAQCVATGWAKKSGSVVVFVSCEMPKDQLTQRLIAAESGVPLSRIRAGRIDADQRAAIVNVTSDAQKLPLYFVERRGATVADVRAAVRMAHRDARRRFGDNIQLGGVVVDYIQVMRGDTKGTRENEVGSISRALMAMPAEFGCPVIALSQLNRGLEDRSVKNKRPKLSDLRESGSLEQDAYAVVMVYREDYYEENPAENGIAEAIIAKNRNGRTGMVELEFRGPTMKFVDTVPDFADATDWGAV
jgi:replicative DNA helicase